MYLHSVWFAQYYADARLVAYREQGGFGSGGKGRKQDAAGGGGSSGGSQHTYYLELLSSRERSTAYRCRLHDLTFCSI